MSIVVVEDNSDSDSEIIVAIPSFDQVFISIKHLKKVVSSKEYVPYTERDFLNLLVDFIEKPIVQ